jgi:hypothetical protein
MMAGSLSLSFSVWHRRFWQLPTALPDPQVFERRQPAPVDRDIDSGRLRIQRQTTHKADAGGDI